MPDHLTANIQFCAYRYESNGKIAEMVSNRPESSKVVSLAKHRRDPHITGPAICLQCKSTWTAVAPPGLEYLDCPACTLQKGVFQGLMEPGKVPVFVCSCGGSLWQFRQCDGGHPQCIKCGNVADYAQISGTAKR